jgi:hypothetical protein
MQMPRHQIVGRICRRPGCDGVRHTVAEVWDEPTRALLVGSTWADDVRAHARVGGVA